jgi:hypothetical protein
VPGLYLGTKEQKTLHANGVIWSSGTASSACLSRNLLIYCYFQTFIGLHSIFVFISLLTQLD